MQAQVYDVQATIDEVLRKVSRIDVNVAEGNLRSALRHVMTGAITDDFVDPGALSAIAGDLDKFADSFDGFGFGWAGGLKLSGDVRDMLGACLNAYRGARLAAMNRHNRRVLGSPLEVVAERPLFGFDVESLRSAITFILVVVRSLKELGQEVGQRVYDEFFFAEERTAARYRSLIGDEFFSQLLEHASICHPLALDLAEEIEPILGGHEDVAELDRAVGRYLSWWASGCDVHLVWSLLGELTIYSDRDFWRSMEGWDGRRDNAGRDSLPEQFDLASVETWIRSESASIASRG
jgi:hypothetical protein